MAPRGRKNSTFTPEEDEKLRELVSHVTGKIKWSQIAKFMPNRNAKQCRDRYNSYLCPGLTNSSWTEEEDALLLEKLAQLGTKWKEISKFFPNRGSNNIKNRWYKFLCKTHNLDHPNSVISSPSQQTTYNCTHVDDQGSIFEAEQITFEEFPIDDCIENSWIIEQFSVF